MTGEHDHRSYLQALLGRLGAGAVPPHEVFAEARGLWLSGRWPSQHEQGFDVLANNVLFFLADAREMGVTHDDASVLLAYLEADNAEAAQELMYEHVVSIDWTAREALQESDAYYGPRSADVDDAEIGFSDPEQRRLHRGIRTNPESVWVTFREKLCEQPPRDELFLQGLLEDLMFGHAAEFIDRVQAVAKECAHAREVVAFAHVGGVAPTPALRRFWRLQEKFAAD